MPINCDQRSIAEIQGIPLHTLPYAPLTFLSLGLSEDIPNLLLLECKIIVMPDPVSTLNFIIELLN